MNKGRLIIISSPSGGGKGAVIKGLLKKIPNSYHLPTATTRPMRPRDRQGVGHDFISQKEFKDKIKNGEILEYNFYAGNYYGTEKLSYKEAIKKFAVVLLEIDINGKKSLDKLKIPHISIFLIPDNLTNLEKRIARRGGTPPDKIKARLKIAADEMKEAEIYDFQIINEEGKLDKTIDKVAEIIQKNTL